MSDESLTATELARGWVEFHCDAHGFLVATTPSASVWCRCGKLARRLRSGRVVDRDTLRPTAAKPRMVKANGHPFLHGCGDCGLDFGSKTAFARHRVGKRGHPKRCLSPAELTARGWHEDERGRWRRAWSESPLLVDIRAARTASEATEAGARVDGRPGRKDAA